MRDYHRLPIGFVLGFSAFAASLGAQARPDAFRFAGCYALSVTVPPPGPPDTTRYAIPRRIRLDTVAAEGGWGWKLTPNLRYPEPSPFWPNWHVRGDSVTLTWSNGFGANVVTLRVRDSLLVGEAFSSTDNQLGTDSPRPYAAVTALRQPCDSR